MVKLAVFLPAIVLKKCFCDLNYFFLQRGKSAYKKSLLLSGYKKSNLTSEKRATKKAHEPSFLKIYSESLEIQF